MQKLGDKDHPWRNVRENAAYQRRYKHIRRDIKIGQMWVLLAIFILLGSTLSGAILSMALPQLPVQGALGKMIGNLDQRYVIMACCFVIIQCLFLFIGSKYMYTLAVWQMVPVAIIGLMGIVYLFSMPDTRQLSYATAIVFSPYFLCAGILTLSWRARLYLAYMSGAGKL